MPQTQLLHDLEITSTISAKNLKENIIPPALWASSAHNTQPWKFKVTNNNIDVCIDWTRHLNISDPTLRELYISIGCTITNILIAARHNHFKPEVAYFPNGEEKDQPVASITITPDTTYEHSLDNPDLYNAIYKRRTDRSLYNNKPLTEAEKRALFSLNTGQVLLIESEDQKKEIGALTKESTYRTLSRKDFKNELSHWVRNSWTKQLDGMPGYSMGMPAPVSLLAPFMVRVAPIHKQEGPKTEKQITSASALGIIVSLADTPSDWVRSGQLLELVWLEATAVGLAASPVIASIEAGQDTRQKLKDVIKTDQLPQSVIRFGHSKKINLRPVPHRSVEDCLI